MEKILIIGSGALARDFVDIFGPHAFVGSYVDPGFSATPVGGLPVFLDWQEALTQASHYIIGVSDIEHRKRARLNALNAGLSPASPMISDRAIVSAHASLSPGCVVTHFAVVGPFVRLCEDVLVMHSAIVAHDSIVDVNSVLCTGVCLGGYVQIGAECFIGANSVLAPSVKIGRGSFIAAGASCFRDAEPGSLLVGNPARKAKKH
ncbi:MAG: hypothetical protein A3F74_15290 [Betaproteobacteria bacterium RIFCSPLOWO2_12_FULL_62_58]|nr:MAG: hypothetical protein A3F74_15290 [Betaproteobacteria bacterium RIFCSPLOWO2_12_FULL_62_58]